MVPLQAIHHSNHLSERIPMRVSPTLADTCLASYHSLQSTDSYGHATASGNIPFDSSRQGDSNELPPDPIRPLTIELSSSLRMSFPGSWLPKGYRHAPASSPLPFDSSRRVDSNKLLPDLIWLLAGNLASGVNQVSPDLFLFSFFNTSLYILWLFPLQYIPVCLRVVSIAYNSLLPYSSTLQLFTCIPVCLRTLKSYCVPAIFTQSSEDFPITSQDLYPTFWCRCCCGQWYYLSSGGSS